MDNILQEARTILQTTPHRWLELTTIMAVDTLTRLPAPDEWSAADCLQHLIDVEKWVMPVRVKNFLAGQDFAAFDPDSQGTKSGSRKTPADLAAEFASLRKASLELYDQITQADLTRQARHQELGMVTLSQMLNEWAGHDLMHTVQAEQALMQPYIQGCGPWIKYFKDHIAGK
jgi:hypothetical protein